MKTDSFDERLDFVASHYREGAFDADSALRRLGFRRRPAILRRAAIIAGAVALTASAVFLGYRDYETSGSEEIPSTQPDTVSAKVVRLEFNDAPLSEVTDEVCRVYGVTLANIPVKEYRLTLSYEGNVYDLIATINELLGTNIVVCD